MEDAIRELIVENLSHGEYFIRIVVAGLCGAVIGFERSKKLKEAGIRTHIILALGAALIMVISKYGFYDFIDNSDHARVASNIVNGVSFLCAGVIFVRSGSVKGLTTAAGIWATAAIGMAVGSGMYLIGITSTILILFVHLLLHKKPVAHDALDTNEIIITVANDDRTFEKFTTFLEENDVKILSIDLKKRAEETTKIKMTVHAPEKMNFELFLPLINDEPGIIEFTILG